MPARYFSNDFAPTQLAVICLIGDATIQVNSAAGAPTKYPYVLTIDKNNNALKEAVEVTGPATGTGPYTLPVTRGVDGTSPVQHGVNAPVSHDHTKRDYEDLQTIEPRTARYARSFLFSGA